MQPTTRPISTNKKLLIAMRFVFFMDSPMQLIPTNHSHNGHSKYIRRCGAALIQQTRRFALAMAVEALELRYARQASSLGAPRM
jgi:hypothetical protein